MKTRFSPQELNYQQRAHSLMQQGGVDAMIELNIVTNISVKRGVIKPSNLTEIVMDLSNKIIDLSKDGTKLTDDDFAFIVEKRKEIFALFEQSITG